MSDTVTLVVGISRPLLTMIRKGFVSNRVTCTLRRLMPSSSSCTWVSLLAECNLHRTPMRWAPSMDLYPALSSHAWQISLTVYLLSSSSVKSLALTNTGFVRLMFGVASWPLVIRWPQWLPPTGLQSQPFYRKIQWLGVVNEEINLRKGSPW